MMCDKCGQRLTPGMAAWARDWTVFDDAGRMTRTETRYTCDTCEERQDDVSFTV